MSVSKQNPSASDGNTASTLTTLAPLVAVAKFWVGSVVSCHTRTRQVNIDGGLLSDFGKFPTRRVRSCAGADREEQIVRLLWRTCPWHGAGARAVPRFLA